LGLLTAAKLPVLRGRHDLVHPLPNFQRVCFIKNTVNNPNIEIGDYTYFDDPEDSKNFERNVLYHFDFIGDKLKIGKFCAIATEVKFIMNGANHRTDTLSGFPFAIFGPPWSDELQNTQLGASLKGDTVIGHDVWFGYASTIMPGVHIGNGAIIAARSVVTSNVEPFSVYGGNPAKLIRKRFSQEFIDELQEIAWWNWDYGKITENLKAIFSADIDALKKATKAHARE
jgi:virginiamycin A acetyltransferase